MRTIVVELDSVDADILLALLHVETLAPTDPKWKEAFLRIKNTIDQAINSQQPGQFFQCSACTDDTPLNPKPEKIRQNSP